MSGRLRVGIVGAGLGGLTVAIALRRADCDVTVFEQAPTLGEVGAGINLTPNVLRALRSLGGLDQRVLDLAFRPENHVFRDWRSGRALFQARVKGAYEQRFGAPVCNVHRADLHEVLRREVPENCIRLNAPCVDVRDTPGGATLTLADGTENEFNAVVGADGIRSAVRKVLFGADAPRFTGNIAWRFTVPAAALRPGLVQPNITNWLGPGGHVVHYYVRRGELVNVVAVHETDDWTEESWALRGNRDEILTAYEGWNENLLELFSHATDSYKWGLFDRAPLQSWTRGCVTLLGDAAHPMLPFLGQGAAMAIEDGVALGLILTGASASDVAGRLARYESLRLPRTARAQLGSRARARENHLRSPFDRFRRNLKFRLRQWFNPRATLHAAEWLYQYDVKAACSESSS